MRAAKHIGVSISRSLEDVYAYASDPSNLPQWASGLASGIEESGGKWFADTPHGRMEIGFAPKNAFGILDHIVIPPTGDAIDVPMRVIANGVGSEVVFTLFRQPGMTDQGFADDARWVTSDLEALKRLLEI